MAGRGLGVAGRAGGLVKFGDAKKSFGFGENQAGVGAKGGAVVGEIGHAGGKTAGDPGEVTCVVGMRAGGGEAGEFEAFGKGGGKDRMGSEGHRAIMAGEGWGSGA